MIMKNSRSSTITTDGNKGEKISQVKTNKRNCETPYQVQAKQRRNSKI